MTQHQTDYNVSLILSTHFQSKSLKSKSYNSLYSNLVPHATKIPYSTCECHCEQESQIGYVTGAERPEAPPPASTHYYPSVHHHNLKTGKTHLAVEAVLQILH
jgi:hypothetical protein